VSEKHVVSWRKTQEERTGLVLVLVHFMAFRTGMWEIFGAFSRPISQQKKAMKAKE
jgi:hypothetical protein